MADTYNADILKAEMSEDEGTEAFPYTDSRGYLSIARGRNLTGKGLSPAEIEFLYDNDVAEVCGIMDRQIPWWRSLPPAKQRVMINLCFMGWGRFSGFHKFMDAMQQRDYERAGGEIRNSLWFSQVRDRGPRVVARLLAPDAVA